ncbi:MAG: ATP-binding protein [Methylotenera sp.]|nr:ATP-binding protein [Methylotenera sp.]
MVKTGFFAYPSSTTLVVDAVRSAALICKSKGMQFAIKTWEEIDIPGKFIATEILNEINSHDFFIADISKLNFNVTYEIGYAIGKGKRVILFKNRAVRQDTPTIQEVGIFDTLGYEEYSTATEICDYINKLDMENLRPHPISDKINEKSPIYLVQPKTKTDYDGHIVSGIKKSHLYFRSFDPSESNRLAGPEAISSVSESYGVVLHFLPEDHVDAKIHNVRSAFVAGLADGLDKRSLYIQTGETPVPVDLRDFVTYCRYKDEFKDAIGNLAERVYEDRDINIIKPSEGKSKLATMDLGASAAENEITSLAEYYLETEAFRRAQRKEVRLVTGRKGSGKTAIFFMLRDIVRSKRSNVVLDLKPEGYQLLKLKDSIVNLLSIGTVEHTITAFWEYLLWLELCYKLLEKDQELHKRNHHLFEPYQRLKAAYITDAYSSEGDFAERLNLLLRDIIAAVEKNYEGLNGVELTTQQITELVYRHDFNKLKGIILDYLKFKDEIWLLFDNIDKGWATQGVKPEDLIIIRALIEATRKIERNLEKVSISAHTIVFLRNDVFEQLVDATADRGKETRVNVDWDDAEMLRELIRLRIARTSESDIGSDFSTVWSSICTPIIDGEESSQYLIDRCLMRPRSLLDLLGHCRGYAMNLGHERILKEDIIKGCSAFSNDLLTELDLEIRDVFPLAENLLYAFIGSSSSINRERLIAILNEHGVDEDKQETVIKLLLWFGFLGLLWSDGTFRYIYSFHYNMKVLEGVHNQMIKAKTIMYVLNPAFTTALGLT